MSQSSSSGFPPNKLNIYVSSQLVFSTELASTLELGRQQIGEAEPYARTGDRIVIAKTSESDISRKCVRIERLTGDRVKVFNLSAVNQVLYGTSDLIEPNADRELPLPATLSIRNRVIELTASIENTETEHTILESFQHSPAPPGQQYDSEASIESMLIGRTDQETEFLLRGLHLIIGVYQQASNPKDFFESASQGMIDVVGLEFAAVLTWDEKKWNVESLKTRSDNPPDVTQWEPSQTVLDHVRLNKRTYWQIPKVDLVNAPSLIEIKALIAAPLLDSEGKVVGALYGDRRRDRFGNIQIGVSEVEAILVEVLASSVASGLSRVRYQRAADEARVLFEQFFTPQLSRELESNPDLLVGKDVEVSLLFCEIRGFSEFSEQLGARLTLDWINDAMGTLSSCLAETEGTLVDMMGDELIGMWGAPMKLEDHAIRACRAAVAMFEQLPGLNRRWQSALEKTMDLAIGIHTGVARVGNIGSERKFKYGPLGTTVRVAIQTQRTTKQLGAKILLTDATKAKLDDSFSIRQLSNLIDKQTDQSFEMFELMPSPPADWEELKRRYETAVAAFNKQDYPTAISLLGKILADHPGDRPSLQLMTRINTKMAPKPWSL